jgi:hypothetical protein
MPNRELGNGRAIQRILFIFSFFLLLCWVGVHCDIYKSSFNISDISYLNSPLHHSPLFPPLPIPGIVATVLIFPFTCMCTQYLHPIHPSRPCLHILPLPLVLTPQTEHGPSSCSDFVKQF